MQVALSSLIVAALSARSALGVAIYYQRGGIDYTGDTNCDAGPVCTYQKRLLLADSNGSDLFMVYDGGYYYLLTTTWSNIQITRATTIAGLKTATVKVVWTQDSVAARCCNYWAPEVHKIGSTARLEPMTTRKSTFSKVVLLPMTLTLIRPKLLPLTLPTTGPSMVPSSQSAAPTTSSSPARIPPAASSLRPTRGPRALDRSLAILCKAGGGTVGTSTKVLNPSTTTVLSTSHTRPPSALPLTTHSACSSTTAVIPPASTRGPRPDLTSPPLTATTALDTTASSPLPAVLPTSSTAPLPILQVIRYTMIQPMSWASDGVTPIFPVPVALSASIPAYP